MPRKGGTPMMKASFAAIALAALLATGAAAQGHEPTAEERIAEMKARTVPCS